MKIVVLFLLITTTIFAWKMEAGKIKVNSTMRGPVVTHINFRQTYDTPPLVFTLTHERGSHPAILRVVNVTTSGFDIYPIEPQGEDGPHLDMKNIPYIAIEEGEHTLPNGVKIVAKALNITNYQGKYVSGTSWYRESLSGFSTTPVVLAQIQTRNNERTDKSVPNSVSKPWFSAIVSNISSSGFDIALDRSETDEGEIKTYEKVGYLAIDSNLNGDKNYFGDNSYKKIEFETIRSDAIVKGWDDSTTTINFSKSYDDPIVVATKNSRNEDDGGWFRHKGIEDDYVKLVVEEDRAKDSERHHIGEVAGIVVFSQSFDANFIENSNPANLIINEVMYKETHTGTDNDEFIEFFVKESGELEGYVMSDQDTNFYVFPKCKVDRGDYVILYTGTGTNSCSGDKKEFYQGKKQYLNNDRDDILLLKPAIDVTTTTQDYKPKTFNATPQDYIAYGESGGAIDEIPTSLKGVKLNWDYSYGSELDNASSGLSIALTPNAIDSDTSACWEFSASLNAQDNGCSNYKPTRDSDPSLTYTTSKGQDNNGAPKMSITKSSIVISDPVNSTTNPKRIPGSTLRYCFVVDNSGNGVANDIKIKDKLSGSNKESLIYKKSGSLIQSSLQSCDCTSSLMDESKGSINGDEVTIEIGSLSGSATDTQTSRACAFIEVELE